VTPESRISDFCARPGYVAGATVRARSEAGIQRVQLKSAT